MTELKSHYYGANHVWSGGGNKTIRVRCEDTVRSAGEMARDGEMVIDVKRWWDGEGW